MAYNDVFSYTQWEHVKTGETYAVVGVVVLEKTLESAMVYTPVDPETGKAKRPAIMWCRPLEEFLDGRFRQLGLE